jgi:hypothetical protein
MVFSNRMRSSSPAFKSVVFGATLGLLLEVVALFAAFISAGAGHGEYIAARALFPASMLLTLIDGHIGPLSLGFALVQFPLYGVLIGWAQARGAYRPAAIMGSLHLAAAIFCFGGALSDFS